MTTLLHLKPTGLVYGRSASLACEAGLAGAIADGSIAFTQLELIEGKAGAATRQTRTYCDVSRSQEPAVQDLLARIVRPRAAIAGLSLEQPRIMGVVNVTPDSFSDGGLYSEAETAISHAAHLAIAGADIVDIGGESTRPGSEAIDSREEHNRVIPVLEGLRGGSAVVSIDTRRAAIMSAGAKAGAQIINDVSALTFDDAALATAAHTELPVILMHAQGDPRTMQRNPTYDDVVLEVFDYLEGRIAACEQAGISRSRIVADPGIGFGKTIDHNLALLSELSIFHGLGVPILLGVSRKSFIGTLSDEPDPQARQIGSVSAALAGIAQGVQLVRVHDVTATRQALRVWTASMSGMARTT